jgi:hypothetical protein
LTWLVVAALVVTLFVPSLELRRTQEAPAVVD